MGESKPTGFVSDQFLKGGRALKPFCCFKERNSPQKAALALKRAVKAPYFQPLYGVMGNSLARSYVHCFSYLGKEV